MNYRFIVSVIDVFSKYLHKIPLNTKSGPSVASAFRSIFDDPKYSIGLRTIWALTDKGKEFLIIIFRTYYRARAGSFSFKCAATRLEMCGR